MATTFESVVSKNTRSIPEQLHLKAVDDLQLQLLPYERFSHQEKVPKDDKLAKKYPIFDVEEALFVMKRPWFGIPVPQFALFNVMQGGRLTWQLLQSNDKVEIQIAPSSYPVSYHEYYNNWIGQKQFRLWNLLTATLSAISAYTLFSTETSLWWMFACVPMSMIVSVLGMLIYYSNKKTSYRLIAQPSGITPLFIRRKIAILQEKQIFDSIHVFQEIDKWETEITSYREPVFVDPLLLGQKDGFYYRIAKFDVTKLESYFDREFSTGPVK